MRLRPRAITCGVYTFGATDSVGAILGAIAGGNRTDQTYGIEFTDGAKVVVQITGVVGDGFEKTWRCLYLYARENGLIDVDF